MKQLIIFLWSISSFISYSKLEAQTWTPLEMHSGGKVTGIISHPTNDKILYCRTDVAGIYKTTNRGERWEQLLLNVPKYSDHIFKVRGFVINPNNPNELFFASGNSAGGDSSGIWKSTNGGDTWTLKTEMAAFSGNGNYRWADNVLAYRPNNSSQIYAGAQPMVTAAGMALKGGVYFSINSGEDWSKINTTILDDIWITKLLFDPVDDDLLYIAAANPNISGIANSGGLWSYRISTETLEQLTTNEVVDVDFDAVNTNTMMAVGPQGIFISSDKGSTWSPPNKPFNYEYLSFVTPHPTESNHWFFGAKNGFFSSGFLETIDGLGTYHFTTYGKPNSVNFNKITWPAYAAKNTNTQPVFGGSLSNLHFNTVDPTTVYFNNVWRSDNVSGRMVDPNNNDATTNANWNWRFTANGIFIMVGIRVSPHPTNDSIYTLNVADVNQYETLDNGKDMLFYGLMKKLNYSAVTKYFNGNTNIRYSGGVDNLGNATLNKTLDGTTWNEVSSSFFDGGKVIQDLQIDPVDANIVIVGLENKTLPSQLYRSDDGGISWTAWDDGAENELFFKKWEAWSRLIQDKDGQTYYVWNSNKLFKRTINGTSWQEVTLPITTTSIRRISTAKNKPGHLYMVYNQSNQLFYSNDYGETWNSKTLPYNSDSEFVSVSPSGKRAIVARRHNFGIKRAFALWINNDIEKDGIWEPIDLSGHASLTKTIDFLNEERVVSISRGHGSFLAELPDNPLSSDPKTLLKERTFKIIPNPVQNTVNIHLDDNNKTHNLKLRVTDINGRVLLKTNYKPINGNFYLNVSNWESGVYFVRLSSYIYTSKVIKLVKY